MGYGIKIKVSGDYACFTRPEMKAERVSYDVITPSAARGILEAVYWKPEFNWIIDKITVLNKIDFVGIKRNEVGSKFSTSINEMNEGIFKTLNTNRVRQQRTTLMLQNVAYIVEAHFEIEGSVTKENNPEKHYNIILRRLKKGQAYHKAYLGCREFPAKIEYVEREVTYESYYSTSGEKDLGFMLLDQLFISKENDIKERGHKVEIKEVNPQLFRAIMNNGVINIPKRIVK